MRVRYDDDARVTSAAPRGKNVVDDVAGDHVARVVRAHLPGALGSLWHAPSLPADMFPKNDILLFLFPASRSNLPLGGAP